MSTICLLLACFISFALIADEAWLQSVVNRVDPEAVEWLRKSIAGDQTFAKQPQEATSFAQKQCYLNAKLYEENSHIFICISFSVPDQTWIALSKELEKVGGSFVLQGLPNGSFKELSQRIQKLTQLGVLAPIQIHPQLFEKCSIKAVPAFIVLEGDLFDKVSGNISLHHALGLIQREGETKILNNQETS